MSSVKTVISIPAIAGIMTFVKTVVSVLSAFVKTGTAVFIETVIFIVPVFVKAGTAVFIETVIFIVPVFVKAGAAVLIKAMVPVFSFLVGMEIGPSVHRADFMVRAVSAVAADIGRLVRRLVSAIVTSFAFREGVLVRAAGNVFPCLADILLSRFMNDRAGRTLRIDQCDAVVPSCVRHWSCRSFGFQRSCISSSSENSTCCRKRKEQGGG